jgi:outer membrane receptor for ferrienterochelin and colicin
MGSSSMTFRHKRLVSALSSIGFGIFILPAASAQQADPQPQKIEKIEVTGSNIKRIEGESALPVQVITREQIERTGATPAEQLLQTISVALQGNSNTVAANVAGSNTAGVTGASLRGLGSQRTLVLINGRRISAGGTLTDSTTVDINCNPALLCLPSSLRWMMFSSLLRFPPLPTPPRPRRSRRGSGCAPERFFTRNWEQRALCCLSV